MNRPDETNDRRTGAGGASVMTNTLRKVAAALAALMAFAASGALAQPAVAENADGAVAVTVEGRQVMVPAVVADGVVAALRDHADDPRGLRKAIRAVVAEHAGAPDDAELAAAIAALAIFHSRGGSAAVDAIVRGASAGNPKLSAGALLAALPAVKANPRSQQRAERELAQLQATVENPGQISPVQ